MDILKKVTVLERYFISMYQNIYAPALHSSSYDSLLEGIVVTSTRTRRGQYCRIGKLSVCDKSRDGEGEAELTVAMEIATGGLSRNYFVEVTNQPGVKTSCCRACQAGCNPRLPEG